MRTIFCPRCDRDLPVSRFSTSQTKRKRGTCRECRREQNLKRHVSAGLGTGSGTRSFEITPGHKSYLDSFDAYLAARRGGLSESIARAEMTRRFERCLDDAGMDPSDLARSQRSAS